MQNSKSMWVLASIILGVIGISADDWDPMDNTATNGAFLTMGVAAKVHGPHGLGSGDDFDWFQVNLSSGVVYRFESTGNSDTFGLLYDDLESDPKEENDDIDFGNNLTNFRFDHNALVTDTFYIKVGTYDSSATYELLYYIPANDSDGDQLLDSWEMEYFTDLTAEPNLHGDSDPFTNLEEYIAGTDPTNSASFFAVTNGLADGSFVVEWPSVSAREYAVFWAESLTNGFVRQGDMIDHPQNSYTDTAHSAESSGFYKVEVQLK